MGMKASLRKAQRSNVAARDLQAIAMVDLYTKGYSPITRNYSGCGLHECDVLAVSGAGFLYELEVKVSRGDYRKDFEKAVKHRHLAERTAPRHHVNRRTGEAQTHLFVPNHFAYFVPEGMVSVEEVPEYAGLLVLRTFESGGAALEWVKRPPRLHDVKADAYVIRSLAHHLTCKFVFGVGWPAQDAPDEDESRL